MSAAMTHVFCRILIAAAMAVPLANCAAPANETPPPADIPENAIPVGENMYMVPLGEDESGCMMYQAHAPGRLVAQVIHYRAADGRFVTDKREAACMTDGEGTD